MTKSKKSIDFQLIMERLRIATKSKSNAALARTLNIAPSTVGTWTSRETIPYEHCVQVSNETGYTLDWIVSGKGKQEPVQIPYNINAEEIKSSLMEGLFTAIQLRGITVQDGIKIGDVADILMTELQENHPSIFAEDKTKAG
jgi:hypothetical protein